MCTHIGHDTAVMRSADYVMPCQQCTTEGKKKKRKAGFSENLSD